MSDTRRVKSDPRWGEIVMRALVDTQGMSVPQKANHWLEKLAQSAYRGRHDTWTAARDRAAGKAGISLTMAERIWKRWATMNDVGGETVLKLMLAYEELCQRNEDAADASRALRQHLRNTNEADEEPASAGVGRSVART